MKMMTQKDLEKNYETLSRLADAVCEQKEELMEILVSGGLTEAGAALDIVLLEKQVHSLHADIARLAGRNLMPGKMAACIPFDVPNFLTLFYCGSAMLAGMPVTIKFAKGMKRLGPVWQRAIEKSGMQHLHIEEELNGKELAEKWMKMGDGHFIVAGGRAVIDYYKDDKIHSKFTNLFVFGPTRPKVLILDSAHQNIKSICANVVNTGLFNSGQLCALEKEIIPTRKNYQETRKELVRLFEEIPYGTPQDLVGPIHDVPTFELLRDTIAELKASDEYRIIAGGKVDEAKKTVSPTLIEAPEGVDPKYNFFGPVMFLNGAAKTDDELVYQVKRDINHGDYVYIYTSNPLEGYKYEGLLKKEATFKRINTNILSSSIDWPYGGLKESFYHYQNRDGRSVVKNGKFFMAHEISY